jgi:predicted transcriptional regulator
MKITNEVLEYDEGRQNFRTTEKGLCLLQMYNEFDENYVKNDSSR